MNDIVSVSICKTKCKKKEKKKKRKLSISIVDIFLCPQLKLSIFVVDIDDFVSTSIRACAQRYFGKLYQAYRNHQNPQPRGHIIL